MEVSLRLAPLFLRRSLCFNHQSQQLYNLLLYRSTQQIPLKGCSQATGMEVACLSCQDCSNQGQVKPCGSTKNLCLSQQLPSMVGTGKPSSPSSKGKRSHPEGTGSELTTPLAPVQDPSKTSNELCMKQCGPLQKHDLFHL